MSYNANIVYPKYQDVIDSQKHMNSVYDLLNNGNYVISGFDMSMSGLTINITSGRCFVSGVHLTFPAGSLTLPANSTVYVKVVLQVNASNKPTGAIITYESTSGGTNKMDLAQVVTTSSTGTITDMRVFKFPVPSKQTLTSSGSMYMKAFWSFVILIGGGGGGINSGSAAASGGIGGGLTIDNCLHNRPNVAVSWTIGAGGSVGNAGGSTSISTSLETITAVGGPAGTDSTYLTSSPLTLFGTTINHSFQNSYSFSGTGQFLKTFSPFIASTAYYYNSNTSITLATGGLGTKVGASGSYVFTNQGLYDYGKGGNTGSPGTGGTAGAIIWHKLEFVS